MGAGDARLDLPCFSYLAHDWFWLLWSHQHPWEDLKAQLQGYQCSLFTSRLSVKLRGLEHASITAPPVPHLLFTALPGTAFPLDAVSGLSAPSAWRCWELIQVTDSSEMPPSNRKQTPRKNRKRKKNLKKPPKLSSAALGLSHSMLSALETTRGSCWV